jgi:hypothetical protein
MSMIKFGKGTRVYMTVRIGAGLEKQHHGVVIKTGARGVQVRFDDGQEQWLMSHQAHLELPGAPEALTAPPAPAAEPEPPPLSDLVKDLAAWREMGSSLLAKAEERVAFAEANRDALHEEWRAAEELMGKTRGDLKALQRAITPELSAVPKGKEGKA